MSRTLATVFVLGVATLLPTVAFPNAASDPAAVIGVVAVAPDQDDFSICRNRGTAGNAIGLNLRYSGAKSLRAYAISIQLRDGDSGEWRSRWLAYSGETIHDEDSWHSTVCGVSPKTDLAAIRTQVDMMAFVGGTYAGPIMLRRSQQLVGSLEATDYARGTNPKLAEVFASPVPSADSGNLIPMNDSTLPVVIDVSIGQDSSNTPLLIVGARNIGAVSILGLEFKISYFDHVTGKFQRSVTTKAICMLDGKLAAMLPGARWLIGGRKVPVSADGALDNYVITVDAVSLADGSFLGARKSLEADELRGIIEGLQSQRAAQHARL